MTPSEAGAETGEGAGVESKVSIGVTGGSDRDVMRSPWERARVMAFLDLNKSSNKALSHATMGPAWSHDGLRPKIGLKIRLRVARGPPVTPRNTRYGSRPSVGEHGLHRHSNGMHINREQEGQRGGRGQARGQAVPAIGIDRTGDRNGDRDGYRGNKAENRGSSRGKGLMLMRGHGSGSIADNTNNVDRIS